MLMSMLEKEEVRNVIEHYKMFLDATVDPVEQKCYRAAISSLELVLNE